MARQSEGKKQEEMASYSAFVTAGFVVTYLRVEIIIVDGWLHPGYQIIAWPLRTSTSTAVFFFFVKTEGNSSFPGGLCVWVCWKHKIKIFKLCYFFFVCFLTTKAALCVSSSLSPSIPNPQSALPPCHFLSRSVRLVCIPASTVVSIFNYNHTAEGFQALSCRAGTILITKLISNAETMPAQADICFATRSWVRVKIKPAAQFSNTSCFQENTLTKSNAAFICGQWVSKVAPKVKHR